MNIKIPYSWLLEYLDTRATPAQLEKYLSLCGPTVESIEKAGADDVLNIEITTNRIDLVSVYGIARDAAAILNRFGLKSALRPFKTAPFPKAAKRLSLTLHDENALLNRMIAVVMDNVSIGQSPQYIKDRLEKAGVRSLNNLIDVTNYVMLEVGHPMHVFDYDRVKTAILKVRNARKGEELRTLDNKTCQLIETDVVIEDGTGRIIDLPGIMGTSNSVVTEKTKKIIVFTESNNPMVIRRTSMRLALRSLAATINEKGPDPQLAKTAMLRSVELFSKLANAKTASDILDVYPKPAKAKSIIITPQFINERLGINLPTKEIEEILKNLEFKVNNENGKLEVSPPSFRMADISIPEDVVEEVARIHGYHNLPSTISPLAYIKQPPEVEKLFLMQSKIKHFLKNLGLNEVMNYSMVSKEMLGQFDLKTNDHLHLQNSISEEIEYMRRHLTISLVKNIKDNEGKKSTLRFFEIAKIYTPQQSDLPKEEYRLGLAVNTSLEDLKGIIEALLAELNIADTTIKGGDLWLLSEGQRGAIVSGDMILGEFGALKMTYQLNLALKTNVYVAYFKFEDLVTKAKSFSSYRPINPYATVKLDLTIELGSSQTYSQFQEKATKASKSLRKLEIVDRYRNKITIRFYFSSLSKNIKEQEAKAELEKIKESALV